MNRVTANLLDDGISGLLGLGFNTIASSGATPFAQTLFEQGALTQPLFSFFLTRRVPSRPSFQRPGQPWLIGCFADSSMF